MTQKEHESNKNQANQDDKQVRWVGHIILLFTFVFLGVWSAIAPINSAVIAPGTVSVKFNSKLVQHLEGGLVKRILVQEGTKVRAGDILIKLENKQARGSLEKLNSEYQGLQAIKETTQEMATSYSEEIAELKILLEEGFVDKIQLRSLQREYMSVIARLAQTTSDLGIVKENIIVQEDMVERTLIRAPVSGTVLGLEVHTEGGVIKQGSSLLRIVPDEQALTIKVDVSPVDIDRVHIGLSAEVLFSAFSSSTTPKFYGKVIYISADKLVDEHSGSPYFSAELELEPESIIDLAGLELLPGMPAEVLIKTGDKTVLQYLSKPITDAFARSFLQD